VDERLMTEIGVPYSLAYSMENNVDYYLVYVRG
jgi:hypothetical protein